MFGARISADGDGLGFGEIVGTYLESKRYTLYNVPTSVTLTKKKKKGDHLLFPIVELVSRRVSLPQICLGSNSNLFQSCRKLFARSVNLLPVLVGCTSSNTARYDDSLNGSYPGRKDQTLVISVNHDHHTNRTGTKTPRVLPNVQLPLARRIARILYDDVEHLSPGKVLTKAVRRGSLDSSSRGGDEPLQGGRVKPSGEFLLLRLYPGDDRNSEEVLIYLSVEVEDLQYLGISLGFGEERCVAFLPEELSCTQEWFCESGSVKKEKMGTMRSNVRGFLNSHRTTLFHWLSLSGRSR